MAPIASPWSFRFHQGTQIVRTPKVIDSKSLKEDRQPNREETRHSVEIYEICYLSIFTWKLNLGRSRSTLESTVLKTVKLISRTILISENLKSTSNVLERTQRGDLAIFLPFWIYVKSILAHFRRLKITILFNNLGGFEFWFFENFTLNNVQIFPNVEISELLKWSELQFLTF